MQRTHRSRAFAPALNTLEGRTLLSGAGVSLAHTEAATMTATEVVFTDQGVYNKKHVLTGVTLMATVKPMTGTGVPTGTVTFDMVMPAKMQKGGMSMAKMKPGTTMNLGTVTLSKGEAMVTVKPSMVLKMPLTIMYSGDTNDMSSMVSPAEITKAGLKGATMGMSSSTKMGGMTM